jgi:hypothetical protein
MPITPLVLRPKPACRSGTARSDPDPGIERLTHRPAGLSDRDGIVSLIPHFSHPGRDVHPYVRFGLRRRVVTTAAMGMAREEMENAV